MLDNGYGDKYKSWPIDSRERQEKMLQESLSPVRDIPLLLLSGWNIILSCARIIYTD